MKILVTGAAGFIGFHLCKALLDLNCTVVGLDVINDYYDINLKYGRLKELGVVLSSPMGMNTITSSELYKESFSFVRMDIQDREELPKLFEQEKFDVVANLAAQAGVRHSIDNPEAYVDSNIVGFLNVLECCRKFDVKRLIYASSSSVYGESTTVPFSEDQRVDQPISLYGATKKSNELMAHSYSHLFGIETIGLRLFTVYGPWGRPDMAMFLFTKAILEGEVLRVFNNGKLSRDFTYIDDIIRGMVPIIKDSYKKRAVIYNLGNGKPVVLLDFIDILEKELGKVAKKKMMSMQDGDVQGTWANTALIEKDYNYDSKTSVKEGVKKFTEWYRSYYSYSPLNY